MTGRPGRALAAALAFGVVFAGCVAGGAGAPGGATGGGAAASLQPSIGALPPPGYGRMSQDAVSLTVDSAGLRWRITPLAERVILAAAPDTYRRLRGLRDSAAQPDDELGENLFLVSVFTREPGRPFTPGALTATSGARSFRATRIVGVTGGWATERVEADTGESAIYIFDRSFGLERDLTFSYGDRATDRWDRRQAEVDAELVRARVRAGGG